jgi:hypothetical protein
MPYDHKNTTPDGLPLQRMKSLLEEVNQLHCQKRCMIGSGGGSVGLVVFYLNLMKERIQNFSRPNVRGLYILTFFRVYFIYFVILDASQNMELTKVHVRKERYSCSKHSKPVMALGYWLASCTQIAHTFAELAFWCLKYATAFYNWKLQVVALHQRVRMKILNLSTTHMICISASDLLVLRQTNAFILLSLVYMSILPQVRTCLSRYFAHGTATDFMYDVVRVPMAFTFEVCMSMSAGPTPNLY